MFLIYPVPWWCYAQYKTMFTFLIRSVELSDDGDYMIIYTYEIINEDFLFFAPLKEAIESNFTEKLKLTPINKEPGSFTVSNLLYLKFLSRVALMCCDITWNFVR